MSETDSLIRYMQRESLQLATAESCTAGLIASTLADVPGAGSLLECAFVVYTPQAKRDCLGVAQAVLAMHNLTSVEVASAMVAGAAQRCRANVVLANTGVADGAGDGVEAGTQCYAWLFRGAGLHSRIYAETVHFSGGRNTVRRNAADYALLRIIHYHAQWRRELAAEG